jgi:hypothetical protein
MENIDNKIDILMRQKLLMNYNPSMNLDENINAYAKKDLIFETKAAMLRNIFNWVKGGGGGLLKGIGKSLGFIWGLAPKSITIPLMLYAASRFVRRSGRQGSVEKIKDLFDTCRYLIEQPGAQHKKSAKDLVYAFKKGWKIAGLGVDVNGVINIFKRSYKWGDFCKRNKAYNDEYARNSGKQLFDELTSFDNFDATNRVDRLWEEALSKVEANFYEGAAQVTPPEGSSPTPPQDGGGTPSPAPAPAPDAGGTGTTPPRRFCPNGYSAPTDGVYKKCTIGKPVETLQACLGLGIDGRFGPRTEKKLMVEKGIKEFTESQLAQICPPVANIQQTQTTTQQPAQVDSEYQSLTRVPIDGAPIRKKF